MPLAAKPDAGSRLHQADTGATGAATAPRVTATYHPGAGSAAKGCSWPVPVEPHLVELPPRLRAAGKSLGAGGSELAHAGQLSRADEPSFPAGLQRWPWAPEPERRGIRAGPAWRLAPLPERPPLAPTSVLGKPGIDSLTQTRSTESKLPAR